MSAWEWTSEQQMQSYLAGTLPRADYLADREAVARRVVRWGGLDGGQVVFEIGSGEGVVAAAVAPHVQRLVCLDVSRSFLRRLGQTCRQHPNVEPRHIDGDYLDALPASSFHFGYSFHVFIHLDAYQIYHYLLGVARVLRPGGRFAFNATTIGPNTTRHFHDFAGRYRTATADQLDGFMTWHAPELLALLATEAGLSVRHVADDGGVNTFLLARPSDGPGR